MNRKAGNPIGTLLCLGVLLASCSARGAPEVANGVTLLRFGSLNGYPAGLVHGRLSFANGCASLEAAPNVSVTALWSSTTRLDTSSGVLRVIVDGVPFAEGQELSMGGGEYSDEEFVTSLVGPIPEACRGERYWLLTTLVTT